MIDKLKLENIIEHEQDEIIKLASQLIAFPNVSPPGRNSRAVQDYIEAYLKDITNHIDRWEQFYGDPNIIAICPGTDPDNYKSLIINTHVDVVEAGDISSWSFDPFKPFLQDGRLHGRGASDMKAAQAACLYIMKLLHKHQIKLRGDLIFHSVTGEEAGEGITYTAVERGPKADFAIVPDISDLKILGQGGVITGWITIESPVTYHDGVRGKMIHAGGGVFGASAIEKMVRVIQGLQELERHWAVVKQYKGFPPGSSTINPAVIEGGRHAAFIADRCSLWITVHFYPNENYKMVSQEIEKHILNVAKADPWLREHPPAFRWGGKSMLKDRGEVFPSLELDQENEAITMLAASHRRIANKPADIGMSPTVTDAGWLGEAGIPSVIYGPGELALAHAVDESIAVEDLITFTKVLLNFIVQWCNKPK